MKVTHMRRSLRMVIGYAALSVLFALAASGSRTSEEWTLRDPIVLASGSAPERDYLPDAMPVGIMVRIAAGLLVCRYVVG